MWGGDKFYYLCFPLFKRTYPIMKMLVTYLLSFLPLIAFAEGKETIDSTVTERFTLYYACDAIEVDENYLDNKLQLDHIRYYLQKSPRIDSITIYSWASPEVDTYIINGSRRSVVRQPVEYCLQTVQIVLNSIMKRFI